MTRPSFRRWFWIHKWSSLVCTAFLLMACLTGLPLILHDEIGYLLDDAPPAAAVPAETPRTNLDKLVESARGSFPGEEILSIFIDDDEPKIMVYMVKTWEAYKANNKALHSLQFDVHTGALLKVTKPYNVEGSRFLDLMLRLHSDLFAGLPGELFMGIMALLFVAALVSGAVIYGPFMRKLEFGTVRANRSSRIKWLDVHNLIGVVVLAWTVVVGLTGFINELSTPLFDLWQQTDLEPITASELKARPLRSPALSSQQSAVDRVKDALPGMTPISIVFPGSPFSTPYHYLVWTKGQDALTSRLFTPVLVDASSGDITRVVTMPWYLRALEVSRPFHFGDYGGMPLKVIWIVLDLLTIGVLVSGLYLWWTRRTAPAAIEIELRSAAAETAE